MPKPARSCVLDECLREAERAVRGLRSTGAEEEILPPEFERARTNPVADIDAFTASYRIAALSTYSHRIHFAPPTSDQCAVAFEHYRRSRTSSSFYATRSWGGCSPLQKCGQTRLPGVMRTRRCGYVSSPIRVCACWSMRRGLRVQITINFKSTSALWKTRKPSSQVTTVRSRSFACAAIHRSFSPTCNFFDDAVATQSSR